MSTKKKEILIADLKRLPPQAVDKSTKEINKIEDNEDRYPDELKKVLTIENYANLMKATLWCDQYIVKAIKTQIERAIDKNKKTIELIKKLTCARENVDIKMISIDLYGQEIKDVARMCAKVCFYLTEENQISLLSDLLKDFHKIENQAKIGYSIPKIDFSSSLKDEQLIKRLVTSKWWSKRLRQTIERNRCLVFSHVGAVGKDMSKYAAIDQIENFKKKLRAQEAFIKGSVVLNIKTGDFRPLSEIASSAEKRFNQMYTMVKGLDLYAKEAGLSAAMLTLTAPPEFHCNSKHGKNSWHLSDYADQKKAQEWISERWNKVTMRLDKRNATPKGLRISEVHTDGTPHWHSIIFFDPEKERIIKNAIADVWSMSKKNTQKTYSKTTKRELKKVIKTIDYDVVITAGMVTKKGKIKDEDRKEIGTVHHILNKFSIAANWVGIDPEKGSGASYICKYISKSCLFDAAKKSKYAIDDDEAKANEDKFKEEYEALLGVASTRSTWNLRSFQFYGLPKAAISLWLMYRRQRNEQLDNPVEKLRRKAACDGNFCDFIKLIEKDTPTIEYDETKFNGFGDVIKKAIGYNAKYHSKIDFILKNDKKEITSETKFTYINEIEKYITHKNDFMILTKNENILDIIDLIVNEVRVIHNVPSCFAEKQLTPDVDLIDYPIYDDDPIFW